MRTRAALKVCFAALIVAFGCVVPVPLCFLIVPTCAWGGAAPAVFPNSMQVMMMPTVMNFGTPPFPTSQIAFISFENANQVNRDGGGVLRIIDGNCREIATFPDPTLTPPTPIPPSCPANLGVVLGQPAVPRLAPASGLAVGNVDLNDDVEIVALLDNPNSTSNHLQIIVFNLVGPLTAARLVPKACSAPLLGGDVIRGPSAPAIVQLDDPSHAAAGQADIIVDNKVFEFTGATLALKFTGGNTGARSRTIVAATTTGSMPSLIMGRGAYQSVPGLWTGTPGWLNTTLSSSSLTYPAVAELDPTSTGPEIVVTDTLNATLNVLSATGNSLASVTLSNGVPGCPGTTCPCPGTNCPKCGGPPTIGDADGLPGLEIGVATCIRYTMFKYRPGSGGIPPGTLNVVWSASTNDPGGQTTATLYNTTVGARVYYADANMFRVFDGRNGNELLCAPNTSNTAIEGPVIASFDTGQAQGRVIVAANNYHLNLPGTNTVGQRGIRIFVDPAIGSTRSYWNQHTYHATNVSNSIGVIPISEPPSWLAPARNTYRVQQAPP